MNIRPRTRLPTRPEVTGHPLLTAPPSPRPCHSAPGNLPEVPLATLRGNLLSLQGPGGLPQVHDGKASPAAAPQAHKPSWPHRPLWVTLVNEGGRDAEWKSKRLSEGLMGNAGGSGGRRVVLMGKTWKNEAGTRGGREMGRVAGGGHGLVWR